MIAAFLQTQRPGGPWLLCAQVSKGKFPGQRFEDAKAAETWALEHNRARRNVYFLPNEAKATINKKPTREEMARIDWLFVDIDPSPKTDWADDHARIKKLVTEGLDRLGIPTPTLIVDSGGGWQLGWMLKPPIDVSADPAKAQEAENINKALIALLDGDGACFSIDHVYRLPSTVNYASPEKLKKQEGRPPKREAEVWSWTREPDGTLRTYSLTDFAPLTARRIVSPSTAARPATGKACVPVPLREGMPMGTEELLAWAKANGKTLKDSTLARIATGEDPLDPAKYPSRSEALFAVCCDLVRAGADDAVIFAAITDPNNKIAESVREKPRWQAYAADQIQKARANVAEAAQLPTWDRVNKEGKPLPSYWNARTALLLMGVECRYDRFRDRHLVGSHQLQEFNGDFSDHAERILRDQIIRSFGFDPGDMNTNKAVLSLCTENRFDSLIDHIHALPSWDSTLRLDTWLVDYLATEDNPYTREAGAAWLTAAIVRAFEPGAKFDHMLVLMGAQGAGKSTALRILAGDEFFSDAPFLHARDAREVMEVTAGVWILECAELDGMGKKDITTLRATITRQADTGRPAYARSAQTLPRRFVLAGTTNEDRFLLDPAGNRRFWPVDVTRVDLGGLAAARDQLFAEALTRYRNRTHRLILGPEADRLAKQAQERRRVVDEGYMERLEDVQEVIEPWRGQWVVRTEAVYDRLGIPPKDRNGPVPRKVKEVMMALGWKPEGPVWMDGKSCRLYVWAGEGAPGERPPF